MTKTGQPARENNIRELVSFFESGIKTTAQKMSIELEHTIVHDDESPVSYHGEYGVEWLLEQLQAYYSHATKNNQGEILGLETTDKAITLEPAAQVELSVGPFENLSDINENLTEFEQLLESILAPVGEKALTVGYHPNTRASELEIIPKQRYKYMDTYFSAISTYGKCMMRGSASTQVSIDYTSTDDCTRKLRLASALAPLISLMCDNAPVFEGAPRKHHMVRTEIWHFCDPDRCETIPHVMDKDFTLYDYACYVLDTPAILAPANSTSSDGSTQWVADERTFGEIYANRTMTPAEIEHALSMLFPDVRLKTYIEIRAADSMPVPYALAYAALIKGIFYHDASLDALDRLFEDVDISSINKGKNELMKYGYLAQLYGRPVTDIADDIIRIARNGLCGLSRNEESYLDPLARLVSQRTTLALLSSQEQQTN